MSDRMQRTLTMIAPNSGTLLGITLVIFNGRWYDSLNKPWPMDSSPWIWLALSAFFNCQVGIAAMQVLKHVVHTFRSKTPTVGRKSRCRMLVDIHGLCIGYAAQVVLYCFWWMALFGKHSIRWALIWWTAHTFMVMVVAWHFYFNVKTSGYLYLPYMLIFLPYLFYQNVALWNVNLPVD